MMSCYLLIPRGRGVNSIYHIPNEFDMLWHVECHEGPKVLNGCRPVKTAVGKEELEKRSLNSLDECFACSCLG